MRRRLDPLESITMLGRLIGAVTVHCRCGAAVLDPKSSTCTSCLRNEADQRGKLEVTRGRLKAQWFVQTVIRDGSGWTYGEQLRGPFPTKKAATEAKRKWKAER